MTESAEEWLASWPSTKNPRSRAREEQITRTAQRLTVERGLDGFTMDELAEAADVSRRTVFNHFGTKLDAVLGNPPPITLDEVERFRSGLPHGHLVRDIAVVIASILATSQHTREDARRLPALLRDPSLMAAANERLIDVAARLASLAAFRGAELTAQQSRMLVLLFGAVAHEALEHFVRSDDADDAPDLPTLFLDLLEETLSLLD